MYLYTLLNWSIIIIVIYWWLLKTVSTINSIITMLTVRYYLLNHAYWMIMITFYNFLSDNIVMMNTYYIRI